MGWLSGWLYRKSHVINPASGAGTGYQVKIIVHYGTGTDSGADVYLNGKCRTDFGDIRFTASDGSTLLSYWMESYVASDNAVFWVKVNDDLSTNAATIYVYYGNPSATTTSNGDATFLFFDDFLGTALDPNKWTQITPGHTVANSEVWVADPNPSIDQLEGIRSTATISGNFALEVKRNRMRIASQGTAQAPIYLYIDANNRIQVFRYWHSLWGWANPEIDKVVAGTGTKLYIDTTSHNESAGTEYVIHAMVAKVGQTYKFYWDYPLDAQGYVLVYSGSITDFPATQAFYIELAAWNNADTSSFYTDVVFVRKFTDPEPAHGAWGAVEALMSVEESVGSLDAVLRDKTFVISDSVASADALLKSGVLSVLDVVGLSDVSLCSKSLMVSENVGLVEAPLKGWTPVVADQIALIESLVCGRRLSVSEGLSYLDGVLRNKMLPISDAVGGLDAVIAAKALSLLESLSVSDNILCNKQFSAGDVVSLLDAFLRGKSVLLTDAINLSEAVSAVGKQLLVAEASSLLDEVRSHKQLTLADFSSAAEAVLVSRVIPLSDAVQLVDTVKRAKLLVALDALGLSDVVLRNKQLVLADVAVSVDGILSDKRAAVEDLVSLVEALLRTRVTAILEGLGLSDVASVSRVFLVSDELALVELVIASIWHRPFYLPVRIRVRR
jgi:hypothetical protein